MRRAFPVFRDTHAVAYSSDSRILAPAMRIARYEPNVSVSPARPSGKAARAHRAGVNPFAVVNEHFGIVRNQDLLRTPIMQLLRRLNAIGHAGQDFRFRRVGFQEIELRQVFALFLPIVKNKLTIFHMTKQSLCVRGYLAARLQEIDQFIRKIAAYHARKVAQA